MSETQAAPQVTGKMFLFDRPELLTPETHGSLTLKNAERPFEFTAKVRALPLTVSEIPAAARDYPVIFAAADNPLPMAVVGIIDDNNLFVTDTGQWEDHRYIPGYVRRYPFGAAYETGSDRYAIVVDASYSGFDASGDIQLFENGEPTQFTKDAVDFTQKYEQDRQMTQRFVEEIKKIDVLSGQTAQYTPQGGDEQVAFAQYVGVDENKLKGLPDEDILRLRNNGLLPVLYAQLMSMGNWRVLVTRRAAKFNLTEQNVFQPLQLS
ncbi:MAG: SapC family protein [Pseudomonadota bacterium]